MINILKRKQIKTIYAEPGDTVILSYNENKLLTKEIIKKIIIDEVVIFEFNDEFDMKDGFGGIFGKCKQKGIKP